MKKLKSIITLAAFLSLTPAAFCGGRIPIHGVYSAEEGGHFRADNILTAGQTYRITNNTGHTLTVMVLDQWTPRDYFPILNGDSQQFIAHGDGLDLYTASTVGERVRGITLEEVTPEKKGRDKHESRR